MNTIFKDPLSAHSEVLDQNRRWVPDWYTWLSKLIGDIDSQINNINSEIDTINTEIAAINAELAAISYDYHVNVVRDFSADNTGANDATTQIQNAINSIPASGGVVFFPPGTYKISSALSITRSNIMLLGSGGRTGTIINLVQSSGAQNGITLQGSGGAGPAIHEILVQGFRLTSQFLTNFGTAAIWIQNCDNLFLKDIFVDGSGPSVLLPPSLGGGSGPTGGTWYDGFQINNANSGYWVQCDDCHVNFAYQACFHVTGSGSDSLNLFINNLNMGGSWGQAGTFHDPTITNATASFTTASTTISVGAGLTIAVGDSVNDATTRKVIGIVQSYSGTTVTLTQAALAASSGSSDQLIFNMASQLGFYQDATGLIAAVGGVTAYNMQANGMSKTGIGGNSGTFFLQNCASDFIGKDAYNFLGPYNPNPPAQGFVSEVQMIGCYVGATSGSPANNQGNGITIVGVAGVTVVDCVGADNNFNFLWLQGCSDVVVKGNRCFWGNSANSLVGSGVFMFLTTNFVIEGNIFNNSPAEFLDGPLGATICSFTGTISSAGAGNVLNVTAISSGALAIGAAISDAPSTGVLPGTYIDAQLSGAALGIGTYALNTTQRANVGSRPMTATRPPGQFYYGITIDNESGFGGTSKNGIVANNICHPVFSGAVNNLGAASVSVGTNIGP